MVVVIARGMILCVEVVIGMVVPITGTATLCGAEGAVIISVGEIVLVVLLLWWSSSSSKASTLEATSVSKASSTKASAAKAPAAKASASLYSSVVVAAEVEFRVATESSSKGLVEASASKSTMVSVSWVIGAVLPKMGSSVCSAWLATLLILSLLLHVLNLLEFGFTSLLLAVFLVR